MTTHSQTIPQADPKRWKALALLCIAGFLTIMDTSIMQVALPVIKEALGYTQVNLQWVMNAYIIFFGGLLLLGGKLSDLFGQRRIFMWGFAILTLASLLAGLAWNDSVLNVARALQGAGSALITPAAMANIMTLFAANPKEMNKALAFWGLSGAAGGLAGIFLGGVITEWLSWRWTFLIYVPIGILVMFLSLRLLQKGIRRNGRIDYAGAISVTAAIVLLVYGIVIAEHNGWGSPSTIWTLTIGALFLIIFLIIQAKKKEPLMPLRIFKISNLAAGNVALVMLNGVWIPFTYFMTLYLQQVLQYSPFSAGVFLIPAPVLMAITMIFITGKLVEKFGLKMILIVGFIALGGSNLLLSFYTPVDGNYLANVLPPLLLASFGRAVAYIPAQTAAISGAKPEESGLVSGVYNTTSQIGSAISLAIMVVIAAAVTSSSTVGNSIVALNEGFQQGFFWSGMVGFAGAVLALLFIRSTNQEKANKRLVSDEENGERKHFN
ncbi:MFS transporter [Metabacillus herbersteinensis]|uniref:MFS transporter n=1 Tax=Metabacillus herbersteinensis TaxID=283816 RepID=A0ABV6GK15_9BACI